MTIRPAAWRDRIAASRPGPGPLTNTSTCRRPCSLPFLAVSSPALWAANAVDFRDPLNPTVPGLPQASTFPWGSVNVIIVLLKVDWI